MRTGGSLLLDLHQRVAIHNGSVVHLTRIEYEIVAMLARNGGRVVAHERLLRAVMGEGYEDATGPLRVHILNLRKKLEDVPADPRVLLDETGRRLSTDERSTGRSRPVDLIGLTSVSPWWPHMWMFPYRRVSRCRNGGAGGGLEPASKAIVGQDDDEHVVRSPISSSAPSISRRESPHSPRRRRRSGSHARAAPSGPGQRDVNKGSAVHVVVLDSADDREQRQAKLAYSTRPGECTGPTAARGPLPNQRDGRRDLRLTSERRGRLGACSEGSRSGRIGMADTAQAWARPVVASRRARARASNLRGTAVDAAVARAGDGVAS